MMRTLRLIMYVWTSLIFAACQQNDELKLPVELALSMELAPSQTAISFSSGYFFISNLEAYGHRRKGQVLSFEQQYEQGLWLDLNNGDLADLWNFDFPQGAYDSLQFNIQTTSAYGPSLRLQGRYEQGGSLFVFVFETHENLYFQCKGQTNNNNVIVLKHGQAKQAHVHLQADVWFQNLSLSQWQQAQTRSYLDVQTVFISEQENAVLYRQILQNLQTNQILSLD